ncbi:MAG: hypothetical protein NC548_40050 [Lachnospiraceae bacterium]|nr:hypothetical protein [Lachnospiraceae bacterium]MCM1232958.1 hypothetical protein [Ruminococcus flavefaciens]
MDENQHRLPLGLCKQAVLKLEAFTGDIREILEDPDLEEDEKKIFEQIVEYSSVFMAHIMNIVGKECGEEEFLNENFPMDEIGQYPGEEGDLEDQSID